MCKLRGRKAEAQQTNQLHPGQLFFIRAVLGGIRIHDKQNVMYVHVSIISALVTVVSVSEGGCSDDDSTGGGGPIYAECTFLM